jgi:hypothetical protein
MIRICISVILLTGSVTAAAALPNPLADGLRHCADETDQSKRLACFDALAASLPKVEADTFGLTADIARKREPASEHRLIDEAVLPGKIVALGTTAAGRLVFTLDNKQVWVQSEVNPRVQFEIGDVVHIEHGAMSSLWLAGDKGRKTRVKRVS